MLRSIWRTSFLGLQLLRFSVYADSQIVWIVYIAGCILRQNIRILDSIKNQFDIILKVSPDIERWLGHRSQPHPKGNMNSCNHSQGSAKANASLVFQSITYKCVLHISNSCCNWCRVSHISRCYEKIYMK